MFDDTSRRAFLISAGALPASSGAAQPATRPAGSSGRALTREAIEAEIRRRAAAYAGQRYLVVDYYRIRRTLAFPLPVKDLSIRSVPVPSVPGYPWATWMMWELEERANALAYAAAWFHRDEFAAAVTRDLEALAAWPKYCQYGDRPDLSSGHAGRLLWTAHKKWGWLGAATRAKIREACRRHVEEVLPQARAFYGNAKTKADYLALAAPADKLVNIPLIGSIAGSLTASIAEHPAQAELNQYVEAVFGAALDLRSKGYTEGVAYDGYILDFLADWLETVHGAERSAILGHPNFNNHLRESYMLSAPGAAEDVAELGDVEAKEMPFHYSAQAKLASLQSDPVRAWYLRRWRPARIRANALGALAPVTSKLEGAAPPAGVLDAYYARVLRTGWEPGDVAVVAACSTSPASHLQNDNGTLVIGTRGAWIVSDPGYQQYMRGLERDFTIGPAAHNYPLVNGVAQTAKAGRSLPVSHSPGVLRVRIDLTACYPAKAALRSVVRNVWLQGRECVVVADEIRGDAVENVRYHWHGHPDAAWYARDNWILLHMDSADLWFHSPQARLSDASVERQEGSRGQLTAAAELKPAPPVVWWVFAFGDAPPAVEAGEGSIRVAGRAYSV
jgi:hypothetical protein